jgi:hypothetical protein
MKAEMKIETTVELKMTLSEAQWLQGAMQNPPEAYSEEDKKMYKYFFMTLRNAIAHEYPCGLNEKYLESSIASGPNVMFGAG